MNKKCDRNQFESITRLRGDVGKEMKIKILFFSIVMLKQKVAKKWNQETLVFVKNVKQGSPWEPDATPRWCCSLCWQFAHSASSIAPARKTSHQIQTFSSDILEAFVILWWLTSSSSQHRSLASMTSPSSKNSARMTKSNWALSSSILASTFAWFSMSGVASPRSHSCWFWGESKEVKNAQNLWNWTFPSQVPRPSCEVSWWTWLDISIFDKQLRERFVHEL